MAKSKIVGSMDAAHLSESRKLWQDHREREYIKRQRRIERQAKQARIAASYTLESVFKSAGII